jgi:hypothetical protein
MFKRLRAFFSTAPIIRSRAVLELVANGRAQQLLEAIADERQNARNNQIYTGQSTDKSVRIIRIGYQHRP